MLTSVKEAFNDERYYDAISNTINSSITMYSTPDELEKESKVIIESSYKDIKPNINVMSNTSSESMHDINSTTETFLKFLKKVDSMKKSFSTEAAYNEFTGLAYDKVTKKLDIIVDNIIKVYQMIINLCPKIENTISNNSTKIDLDMNLDDIKNIVFEKHIGDMPIVNFLYDEKNNTIDFFKIKNITEFNNSKFSEYISYLNMNLGNNVDKQYLSRIKEKSNILDNISKLILNYIFNIVDHMFDVNITRDGKAFSKYDTTASDLKREIKSFYRFIDDTDYNLWAVHAYKYIPSFRSDNSECVFKDVICDFFKEKNILGNLIFEQHKEDLKYYYDGASYDNTVLSLSSPLIATDIRDKVCNIDISKASFNIKDLFEYDTLNSVIENINNFNKVYNKIENNITLSGVKHALSSLTEASKNGIKATIKYKSLLKSLDSIILNRGDASEDLLRITVILMIKLSQDLNTAISSMNQLILHDISKKYIIANKSVEIINKLTEIIKTKIDGD